MTPSHANKAGRRYRYYVSTAVNDPDPSKAKAKAKADAGSVKDAGASSAGMMRVPAADLEQLVFDRLHQLLATPAELADAVIPLDLDATAIGQLLTRAGDLSNRWTMLSTKERRALALAVINRIDVTEDAISMIVNRVGLSRHLGVTSIIDDQPSDLLMITIPAQLHRSGKGKRLVIQGEAQKADPVLIAMLHKAFSVRDNLLSGAYDTLDGISEERSIPNGQATALLRLSWLAPSIVSDIVDGKQPPQLTPNTMLRGSNGLPLCWIKQRAHLGFGPI